MLPILPTAPSRTDPVNFSAEADAWVAALPAWTDAVNAIEGSLQASTLIGTSTTSLSVGTGSKGFTSQSGKAWLVGAYLFIVATSDNTKVMQGKVTSYNSSTGSLVVDVNLASGSGTYSSWDIGVANPAIGATSGISVAGGTTANWFGMNSTGTPTGLSTGIAAPASDTLGLYTNTVARVQIDASGNVGIGTDSPNRPITINNTNSQIQFVNSNTGTAATDGLLVGMGGASSSDAYINQLENANLIFNTNGTERARFTSTGLFGIGGTPTTKLEVFGSTGNVQFSTTGNKITFTRNGANYIACAGASGSINYSAATHSFYNEAETVERLRIDTNSNILSVANGGIGYGAGSGGSVTQTTSKSALVTLNKISGQITTHNASLAANTYTTFTLNNSTIIAGDILMVQRVSGGSSGCYRVWCDSTSNGNATIAIQNITGGALSEAVVLSFAIIRGSTT